MKETPRSLKIYFGIIGAFGMFGLATLYAVIVAILLALSEEPGLSQELPGLIIDGVFSLISGVFGLLFFYIAIKLDELLVKSHKFIINVLIAALGVTIVNNLIYFNYLVPTNPDFSFERLLRFFFQALIIIYVTIQIKRIAKEKSITQV